MYDVQFEILEDVIVTINVIMNAINVLKTTKDQIETFELPDYFIFFISPCTFWLFVLLLIPLKFLLGCMNLAD